MLYVVRGYFVMPVPVGYQQFKTFYFSVSAFAQRIGPKEALAKKDDEPFQRLVAELWSTHSTRLNRSRISAKSVLGGGDVALVAAPKMMSTGPNSFSAAC